MAFSSEAVANEILRLAEESGKPVTPMKLQKLVYISHGWCLGFFGVPLINEQVEAWKYGPVIPSLYHKFKSFGSDQISGRAHLIVRKGSGFTRVIPSLENDDPDFANDGQEVIRAVFEHYSQYSASQLSNATHESGSPWHKVYHDQWKGSPPQGTDIPENIIKEYYHKLAHEADTK